MPFDSLIRLEETLSVVMQFLPLNRTIAVAYLVLPFSSPLCSRPTITLLFNASKPCPDDSLDHSDHSTDVTEISPDTILPDSSTASNPASSNHVFPFSSPEWRLPVRIRFEEHK